MSGPRPAGAPDQRRPLLQRGARWLRRMTLEPGYRYNRLMRLGLVGGSFQADSSTWADRYPKIFDFVAARLGDGAGMRLISFGCATGEEVFTLRRRFPGAAVRGLDINPANIRRCLQRQREQADAAVSFARASSTAAEPAESCDAIFCLAVLRDGRLTANPPEDCSPYIRFADFERAVGDFHRCLKPGGLLALRHTNFRLRDSAWSACFEPVFTLPPGTAHPTPMYGPDNRLMPNADDLEAVFRKR